MVSLRMSDVHANAIVHVSHLCMPAALLKHGQQNALWLRAG